MRKENKALTLKNTIIVLNGRQKVLNAFESGIFLKLKQGERLTSISDHVACVAKVFDHKVSGYMVFNQKQLKVLTPKQMFQRLPIAPEGVKPGNNLKSY